MKRTRMNVVFTDPIKALKETLSRSGAKDIDLRRLYGYNVEVRYNVAMPDPKREIAEVFTKMGAKNVRIGESHDGACFEMEIPEIVDERTFKRNAEEVFRRVGYRVR